jgi:hypothetical protein
MRFPKKHLRLSLIFLLGLLILVLSWQYWRVRDLVYEGYFRYVKKEAKVLDKSELDKVLAQFERIPFHQLPADYLAETGSDKPPFRSMLKGKSYYQVPGMAIYRKVVGNFMIKDFLPKDAFYKHHLLGRSNPRQIYWLVDRRMLYKFLEMQEVLRTKGLNDEGFRVVNGYRPPTYNQAVGGASRSRHLLGEAVDLYVQDINKDGKSNQEDKAILLELLDKQVIRSFGGLGKYPGTLSVHFDVRGYRARWDQQ